MDAVPAGPSDQTLATRGTDDGEPAPGEGPGQARAEQADTTYADIVSPLLPPGWHMHWTDMWLHVRAPRAETDQVLQGFKIHVSANLVCAAKMISLVVPVCVPSDVEFKIVRDPERHRSLNAKNQRRGSSGKFMTLYPGDTECFERILALLHETTRNAGLEGPRVLSDRQYADSAVLFYRYGAFRSVQEVQFDGTYRHVLLSPEGQWVKDERNPWFHLPDWVSDPFPSAGTGPAPDEIFPDEIILGERFRVDHAIRFSNSGGIYAATDLETMSNVVIKEARPHTHYWSETDIRRDAVDLLRREYEVLMRLAGLWALPEPITLLSEGGHTFLVESFVAGSTFHEHFASGDVILAPYLRSLNRIRTWSREFFGIASLLLNAVEAVHERGVLIGDFSPHNIIVKPGGRSVGLVDLESAVLDNDDDPAVLHYATQWGTPGFFPPTRPRRERLTRAGDLSGLGLVLVSAFLPMNPLIRLNPDAPTDFLAAFLNAGVPAEVGNVVNALLDGEAGKAHIALERGRSLYG